ncbi:lysozyme inhibitor LprI family protein [Roseibium algae]|uniref:Lysozyme inhibitor LprI family protein n=1 Tax=Roseibium algae TaxID=3123038 RepID=A0ABU8TLY7_9HYPH
MKQWHVLLALLALIGSGVFAKAQDNIDCGYPLTQMELTYCAGESWKQADAELNVAYKAAMTSMKQTDSYLDADMKGAADALRDAQRAWIPFRDKACDSYGFMARGGSMESMLVLGCRTTLTKQRTDALNEIAQGLGN